MGAVTQYRKCVLSSPNVTRLRRREFDNGGYDRARRAGEQWEFQCDVREGVVGSAELESATSSVSRMRSNQLSYEPSHRPTNWSPTTPPTGVRLESSRSPKPQGRGTGAQMASKSNARNPFKTQHRRPQLLDPETASMITIASPVPGEATAGFSFAPERIVVEVTGAADRQAPSSELSGVLPICISPCYGR